MKKGKILVVDNEIKICRILEELLYKKGYSARSAYSGAGAIELLKNEKFDLVLCNYVMPKISGFDVVKSLDVLENRPKVGIITGWGERIDSKEREEMKVSFVIRKPIDFSELMKQVDDTLFQD
ncbi:MAG: response regulator [Candidatus Scalindua sp.]